MIKVSHWRKALRENERKKKIEAEAVKRTAFCVHQD
jgi:hypothetical protein